MTQHVYMATGADNDPLTALMQATNNLYEVADAELGSGQYRIQSIEHSSVLITSRDQVTPDFMGRVLGQKPYVRSQELLLVTATMIAES